ncbi:thioesterase [Corallococcus exiguus]|uniref:thioesterase n=1 Tax=Corallococcus exiguus TaxID=83462 RepID=UPI00147108E7|nr:thioesterase [Corallococcus exiguus]
MTSSWLPLHRARAGTRVRLFCFPFAGGGASVFRPWAGVLPEGMELAAVQPPGREERLSEPPFTSLPALLEAMDAALSPWLEDRPFAFFGHSLGALVAFEWTRRLRQRGGPAPLHLFVSGAPAPGLPRTGPLLHALPEPEFLQVVRQLGAGAFDGLPDAGLLEAWGPLLRADLQLAESAAPGPGEPVDVPLSAFGGLDDAAVSREELAAWRERTRGAFSQHMLPGGHLFIRAGYPAVIQVLWRKLRGAVPGL